MATLSQASFTFLGQALLQNPSTQYFPWSFTDYPFSTYPQGVPRSAVVSAYKTAAMQYGNFTFNVLGGDNFQRASENPLSQGGNWGSGGSFPFEIVAGQCYPVGYQGNTLQVYTGDALPSNQWASITLASFLYGSGPVQSGAVIAVPPFFNILLRSAAGGSSRYVFVITSTGWDIDVVQGGSNTLASGSLLSPPMAGDVWTAAAVGSTLLLYQNGALIGNATDSTLVGGYAGLSVFSEATPTVPLNFAAINNFACGAVVGAPNLNVS